MPFGDPYAENPLDPFGGYGPNYGDTIYDDPFAVGYGEYTGPPLGGSIDDPLSPFGGAGPDIDNRLYSSDFDASAIGYDPYATSNSFGGINPAIDGIVTGALRTAGSIPSTFRYPTVPAPRQVQFPSPNRPVPDVYGGRAPLAPNVARQGGFFGGLQGNTGLLLLGGGALLLVLLVARR